MLEKHIENQILNYLRFNKIMAWKIKTVGTYDSKLGRFRKSSINYRKGVSDILGIYKGKPLAIEVKSQKGRVTPDQHNFMIEFVQNGGIAFVARSLDDVIQMLK